MAITELLLLCVGTQPTQAWPEKYIGLRISWMLVVQAAPQMPHDSGPKCLSQLCLWFEEGTTIQTVTLCWLRPLVSCRTESAMPV